MPFNKCMYLASMSLLLAILFLGSAIAEPNLTGIWIRDKTRGDPSTALAGPEEKLPDSVEVILNIYHAGKLLQIEIQQGNKRENIAYVLDGKKHGKIRTGLGGTIYWSNWQGDTLTIHTTASKVGWVLCKLLITH